MSSKQQVEVITFTRRAEVATIVTDGQHVRVYRQTECRAFDTLQQAIAYLAKQEFHWRNWHWTH